MASSTASLRAEIMALSGVDIMLNANEFKSTYAIMEELSQKWEGLSDIAQASITELLAGKHQGNVMSSLMANFDIAQNALETSLNSSGSAMKEHERWSQSLEAKLLKLKATWQSLSQSFMSSDFLKSVLDGVIGLVNGIDKLISTIGTLPTLLGIFSGFQLFGKIKSTIKSMNLVGGIKSISDVLSILGNAFPKVSGVAKVFFSTLSGGKGVMAALAASAKSLWAIIAAHPLIAAAAAIGAIVVAYNHFTESASELAKRIDEVTSKYKTQHESLLKLKGDYDTSNEDSMISKYGELSKGVNDLGENVSLTADEYAEYQSIIDTIAGQIPSLVNGYNSQGDAILDCAGNVDKLTEAYRNLIREQNKEVLDTGEDIFKDFKNDLGSSSDAAKRYETTKKNPIAYLKEFENLLNLSDDELESALSNNVYAAQISEALEKYGPEEFRRDLLGSGEKGWENYQEHVTRVIQESRKEAKAVLDEASKDINAYADDMATVTKAYFSDAFLDDEQYAHMSERMQNIVNQVASGFDSTFYSQFLNDENPYESLTKYFDSMLSSLDKLSDTDAKSIEAAFDLETQFNGGKISYGDYVDSLEEVGNLVDTLDLNPEVKSQIKLNLGLDEDGLVKQYESLVNRMTDNEYDFKISENEAKKFLDGLSAEEYSVAVDVITELSDNGIDETIDDIEDAIKRKMAIQGLTFDLDLEVEATGIEALNTAMAESVSASGLSSESIAALKGRYAELESQGYNLSSMFEETSHGIHLNRQEFNKLESAYAKQKLAKVDSDLTKMKNVYDQLGEEIKTCDNVTKKSELYNDRLTLAQKISEAATLASQYQALTSAYNDWQSAEQAGQERDMYENVIGGFENIDDEISRGWIDDGSIEFLELLTGRTDLAGKSAEELKEIYDKLDKNIGKTGHSIRDFFTVDEDGNSTSQGVFNFLEAIETLEKSDKYKNIKGIKDLVERDKDNNIIGFNFDIIGGDEAIAEALGISEELVQIMVRAADDAGFVVSIDGTYRQLADLQNEAKAASDVLKELGMTDFEFDFNTSDIEDLNKQLDEAHKILDNKDFWNADGTFNFEAKGATEAMTIVSTLQAKLDSLKNEQYGIGLTVEDEEFEEPLENLQEYGRTVATLNQLKLNPEANTEDIEKLEGELDEIAQEFNELPDEKKIEIGLVGEKGKALTEEYFDSLPDEKKIELGFVDENGKPLETVTDAIQKKIESGEVKIPTVLDIQANMDKNIETLADLALLNSGLLSEGEEEVIRKKYKIELKADEVDDSDIEKSVDDVIDGKPSSKSVVEKEVNVETYTNTVNTSDTEKKTEDAVNNKNNKKSVVEKEVNVDTYTNTVDTSDTEKKTKNAVKGEENKKSVVEKQVDVETVTGKVDTTKTEEDLEKAKEKIRERFSKEIKMPYSEQTLEVAVEFLANTEEIDDYTPEQLNAIVKYIVETDDIESYTPEQKEALVTFFANTDDPDSYTPEQKQAIVDYLAGKKSIDEYDPDDKEAVVNFLKNSGLPDEYQPDPKTGMVKFKKDSSIPDNYKAPTPPPPIVIYKKDSSEVDRYNPKNIIRTVTYKIKEVVSKIASGGKSKAAQRTGSDPDGYGEVNGTANVNGTTGRAFKQGSWGTKNSGTALVGELGRETLVRDGRYYTIGDSGAEFIKYQRGDIIFNHRQTEELFNNGKVTSGGGRAKALASGTAFSKGSGGGLRPINKKTNKEVHKAAKAEYELEKAAKKATEAAKSAAKATEAISGSKGSGGGLKSEDDSYNAGSRSTNSKKEEDKFEESFDWIETKISRLERVIDQLDTKANSVYRSWSERNSNLVKEIGKVEDEIALQQTAYNKYMSEASKVGLSSSWAKKVRDGAIDFDTIKDENLAEKIKNYQELYEAALACQDAVLELTEKQNDLISQKFDNIITQYENLLSVIEHEKSILDEYIAQSEAQGWLVSGKYYEALIDNEEENISKLQKEKEALLAELNTVEKGTEEWYRRVEAIDEITLAIEQGKTAILEYQQTIQQLSWEVFDLLQDKISSVTEEADFLIELMSNKRLYDDRGQLTDEGMATMGLHGQNYNTYMYQADLAAKEAERLKKELEKDPYDTELEERYREMIALQQEYILAAEDEKNAIRDLVEEGINLELDALQELIDKRNEELDSVRDLYEYNKKVKEQTEEIAALEKQMAAYAGDDSEEAKQKIQQIKVELESAKENLQETEYDKYIEDTSKLLDELYLEYEEILNMRLDNIDALISDMIMEINADADIIGSTITESADAVGYTLSDSMQTIWDSSTTSINGVITMYGDKFTSAQTTANNALSTINTNLQKMISQLNSIASTKVKAAKTSSSSNPPKSDGGTKDDDGTKKDPAPTSGGDGVAKEGDKVKFVSGKYYYDSYGKKPLGSKYQGKYVYITNINKKGSHPYHISTGKKLGSGDLGWLKLNQISEYAVGKKNFLNDEIAWTQEKGQEMIIRPSDGAILTPIARKDSILTANASNNIWDMANSPSEFIKDNLNLGSTSVPNNSNSHSNIVQNFDNIVFSMPNVKNYDEMLRSLQKDPNFSRLVQAMTVNQIAGKSKLAVGKALR